MIRLIFILLIFSCAHKKSQIINTEYLFDVCKKEKNVDLEKLSLNIEKSNMSHLKWYIVGRCLSLSHQDRKAIYFFNKQNFKGLSNSELSEIYYVKARYSLSNFSIVEYERLRSHFGKFKDKDFSLLELHYFMMFSKLKKARDIIKELEQRDVYKSRVHFYKAWLFAQVGKLKLSKTVLDKIYDKNMKSHVILMAFLNMSLKTKKNKIEESLIKNLDLYKIEKDYLGQF